MDDNELIYVDTTDDHVSTHHEDSVPDDREDTFRQIIKDSGTRVNIENLTRSFFSGDVEDRDRLVRVLRKAQITPAKIETVYATWFDGTYPEDDGINLYSRAPKGGGDAESNDEYDTDKLIKDIDLQERLAQKKRISALQAKKLEIEMKRDIKELNGTETNSSETKERIEPVMIMGDDGSVEVAKDESGAPITRRIVEPMSMGSGGSSITELMLMQNIMGKGNNDGNSGIHEIKIQSLEAEIARLRDKIESEKDRHKDRMTEIEARIESIKDKAADDVSRVKEDTNKEILRIREDKDKEISVLRERHEDKIESIENRHSDALVALGDRYANNEQRTNDKMDRVESDASDMINGLQSRHHDDVERLHLDYRSQMKNFVDRADDNLDNTQTTYNMNLQHRDDMGIAKEQNDMRIKQLEQASKDRENMSDAERQNSQIINAVGNGIEKALDTFGKPYAAGMTVQNTITQQALEERAINKKLALIDDMRRGGYSEEDISFVMNPDSHTQPQSHDDAYARILNTDGNADGMIEVDHNMQYAPNQPQQITIPQKQHGHTEGKSTIVMRSSV